jgi:hypothetical protein
MSNNTRLAELLRMYKIAPAVQTRIATTQSMGRRHPTVELEGYAHVPSGIRIRDH